MSGQQYVVDPETGCWLWRGTLDSYGYGRWHRQGVSKRAHREFYKEHVGPIPAGHSLHHICATRRCVNPGHLLPVTHAEHSAIEATERRRTHRTYRREKTSATCSRCGVGMVLYHKADGVCLACRREEVQRRRETIQRMWGDGSSTSEIAEALRTTPASVRVTMVYMRRDGWDLPRRRKGKPS